MGRILVADNYASFRQTVVDALAQMAGGLGYDVEGFADGSGLMHDTKKTIEKLERKRTHFCSLVISYPVETNPDLNPLRRRGAF